VPTASTKPSSSAAVESSSTTAAMKPTSAAPVAASALRRRGVRETSECESRNSAKDFHCRGFLHGRSLQPTMMGSQESILEVPFDPEQILLCLIPGT